MFACELYPFKHEGIQSYPETWNKKMFPNYVPNIIYQQNSVMIMLFQDKKTKIIFQEEIEQANIMKICIKSNLQKNISDIQRTFKFF